MTHDAKRKNLPATPNSVWNTSAMSPGLSAIPPPSGSYRKGGQKKQVISWSFSSEGQKLVIVVANDSTITQYRVPSSSSYLG